MISTIFPASLMTNDFVIAAVAIRLEADALVSADTRFTVVKELNVYAPSGLKTT
jgi:predicted nucleic acid-binding protein